MRTGLFAVDVFLNATGALLILYFLLIVRLGPTQAEAPPRHPVRTALWVDIMPEAGTDPGRLADIGARFAGASGTRRELLPGVLRLSVPCPAPGVVLRLALAYPGAGSGSGPGQVEIAVEAGLSMPGGQVVMDPPAGGRIVATGMPSVTVLDVIGGTGCD